MRNLIEFVTLCLFGMAKRLFKSFFVGAEFRIYIWFVKFVFFLVLTEKTTDIAFRFLPDDELKPWVRMLARYTAWTLFSVFLIVKTIREFRGMKKHFTKKAIKKDIDKDQSYVITYARKELEKSPKKAESKPIAFAPGQVAEEKKLDSTTTQ